MNELSQSDINSIKAITGQSQPVDVNSLLTGISTTLIIVNIIAGLVGMYFFMHGKKTLNIPMLISGILLCVVPYFISNTPLLIIACLIMFAAPYFVNQYDFK